MSNQRNSLTPQIVVLVADDEPSTLALISAHVRAKGCKVVEASDGEQAWDLALQHVPHLVILDVMMPGMSGWEVCRKIRESVGLAHTGIIMLTGIGERLNDMTSPLYGADAHLDKPFEFGALDAKIRETIEHRSAGALGRPDDADTEGFFSQADAAGWSTPPDSERAISQGPARANRKKPAAVGLNRKKKGVKPGKPSPGKGARATKKVKKAAPATRRAASKRKQPGKKKTKAAVSAGVKRAPRRRTASARTTKKPGIASPRKGSGRLGPRG